MSKKILPLLVLSPLLALPQQAQASEIKTEFSSRFAGTDEREFFRKKTTFSTTANDLKIEASAGAETYRDAQNDPKYQTNIPIRFGAEFSDSGNTYRAEIGVDATTDGSHPHGAIEYRSTGKTRIKARVEYGLENASADTVQAELNRLRLSVQATHSLSPNTTVQGRARQYLYSDGNSIGHAEAKLSHKVAQGTTLSAIALHRRAAKSGDGYWTPEDGTTQLAGEVRQGLPIGEKAIALIGLRAGARIDPGDEVKPLFGGGLGIRYKISEGVSSSASVTVGSGIRTKLSINGRF